MIKKYYTKLIVMLAVMSLAGCTSVSLIHENHPEYARVTSFEPAGDLATLYIIRDRAVDFEGLILTVSVNGEDVKTAPASYVRVEVEPGKLNLEPNIPGTFSFEEEENLDAQAGEVYFVVFDAKSRIGIPNKGSVKLVPSEQGKQIIESQHLRPTEIARLAASNG